MGTWEAQLVKHLTLDFGSGYDLRIERLSPTSGSMLSGELASLPLSSSPSYPLPHHTLPLSRSEINKTLGKKTYAGKYSSL